MPMAGGPFDCDDSTLPRTDYMTTEDDFHRMLDADPNDHQTRMIFADWLEDRGDPRAEGYRALGRLGIRPHLTSGNSSWGAFWNDSDVYPGLNGGKHDLPWIELLKPHSYFTQHESRRHAEDHAALAFTQLPPERRHAILNPEPTQSARYSVTSSPTFYSHEAFHQQINSNPDDWQARAVYADWLEDNDPDSAHSGTLAALRGPNPVGVHFHPQHGLQTFPVVTGAQVDEHYNDAPNAVGFISSDMHRLGDVQNGPGGSYYVLRHPSRDSDGYTAHYVGYWDHDTNEPGNLIWSGTYAERAHEVAHNRANPPQEENPVQSSRYARTDYSPEAPYPGFAHDATFPEPSTSWIGPHPVTRQPVRIVNWHPYWWAEHPEDADIWSTPTSHFPEHLWGDMTEDTAGYSQYGFSLDDSRRDPVPHTYDPRLGRMVHAPEHRTRGRVMAPSFELDESGVGEFPHWGRHDVDASGLGLDWTPQGPAQASRYQAAHYMTSEDDFHQLLDQNPDDHHTRQVFADFLQEQGDPRAEGYRALGMLGKFPEWDSAHWWARADPNRTGDFFSNDHHRALPSDWFQLIPTDNPDVNSHYRHRPSRRMADDVAAHAFAQLPPARRHEILNPQPTQSARYSSADPHRDPPWTPDDGDPEPDEAPYQPDEAPWETAMNWHGGQFSGLYRVGSGAIDHESVSDALDEVDHLRSTHHGDLNLEQLHEWLTGIQYE